MPKKQLKPDEAVNLLIQETVGHLATCDCNGIPYITPLNYIYYQGKLYFHGASKGRKLDNLAVNSKVCFEVSRVNKKVFGPAACNYSTRYTSVLVFGTAAIVEDAARKLDLLNTFTEKFAEGRPFSPATTEAAASVTVVEIAIDSIHGKCNVDPENS